MCDTKTMIIHEDIYEQLNGYYKNNQIPNIIFHGASGTGKKRIVTDFIDKIYNNDRKVITNNVMFVNCSHGKGIYKGRP
jgi:Cdc6-like AAA superfamily ATPase